MRGQTGWSLKGLPVHRAWSDYLLPWHRKVHCRAWNHQCRAGSDWSGYPSNRHLWYIQRHVFCYIRKWDCPWSKNDTHCDTGLHCAEDTLHSNRCGQDRSVHLPCKCGPRNQRYIKGRLQPADTGSPWSHEYFAAQASGSGGRDFAFKFFIYAFL